VSEPEHEQEHRVGLRRLADYYLALGRFVDCFAVAEQATHAVLR
jgi:hypothetical protein